MAEGGGDKTLRAGVHHVLLTGVCVSGALMAAGLFCGGPWGARAMHYGIFALISTPPLRVLLLAAGYAWEGDWAFCAVSTTVFAMLLAGSFLGAGH